MLNNKANRLDKVRAAAIFNTKKRFADAEAKAREKEDLLEIAEQLTSDRKVESKSIKKGE